MRLYEPIFSRAAQLRKECPERSIKPKESLNQVPFPSSR